MENHSSNNRSSDSQSSDTDSDTEPPKFCGKIGKRASRFSIYLGRNPIGQYPNPLGLNKSPRRILEINESRTSTTETGSARSLFAKKSLRTSSCSETHLPTSGNDSAVVSRQTTPNCLSDDDGLCDSGKLARSKYQERLLNKALQSCSKFSLDMSASLKLSNSRHAGHDSVVETGFAKKQNAQENPSNFTNRVSIENQLSGFRPTSSRHSVDTGRRASPVPEHIDQPPQPRPDKADPVGAQFKGIQLPNNIFSKKADHDLLYRDSCDVNLEGKKSVIKFYEHWKLTNNKQKQAGPSTGFNEKNGQHLQISQSTTENSVKAPTKQKVKDSMCPRDSNYFDIFESNHKSILQKKKTEPDKQSVETQNTNPVKRSSTNPRTQRTQTEISNQTEREQSTESNPTTLFRLDSGTSKDFRTANNLLSEMLTQSNSKSRVHSLLTETSNRDSLFDESINFLSKIKEPCTRNSAQYNSHLSRDSNFQVDNSVKKKFSVMESQIGARRDSGTKRPSTRGESGDSGWDDMHGNAKLVGMLSLASGIEEQLGTRPFRKGSSKETTLSSLNVSGNRVDSESQNGFAVSTLFIKKKQGNLVKPKSNLVIGQSTVAVQPKEVPINDNTRSIFEISREPLEFSNLLGNARFTW